LTCSSWRWWAFRLWVGIQQATKKLVGELAVQGDRIEGFRELGDTAMLDQNAGLQLVADNDRRHERHPVALARKQPQHGHVVDFSEDDRPNAGKIEQIVEPGPGFAVDPTSASAPFVATLVDVTGLVIYFSVALLILNCTVL